MNSGTNQLLYQIVKTSTQQAGNSDEKHRLPVLFQTKIQMNIFYYLLTNAREEADGRIQTELNIREICTFYEGDTKNIDYYREALEYIRTHSDVTMAVSGLHSAESETGSDRPGEEENKTEIIRTDGEYSVYKGRLIIGYEYRTNGGTDGDDFVVDFNPKLRPALVSIDSRYSTLFLEGLEIVGSRNGARIYIFLISYLDSTNNAPVEMNWYLNSHDPNMPGIRQTLDLLDKYPREYDFRRIVERAFDDVNKYSDIEIQEYRLSDTKDYYTLRFCKKANGLAKNKNRLAPAVQIEPEEIVCWQAVELVNLLANKNYLYSSYTTRARIKKRLRADYTDQEVISAPLKQFVRCTDTEMMKTNMSLTSIYPTVKKKDPDYFETLCQYDEPDLFKVMDQYTFRIHGNLELYQYEALFYGIYLCTHQFLSGWLDHDPDNNGLIMNQAVSGIHEQCGTSLIEFIRSVMRRPVAKSGSKLDADRHSADYFILSEIIPAFGIDVVYKAVAAAEASGIAQMLFVIGILYLLKRHDLVEGFNNAEDPSKFLHDHVDEAHNNLLDSLKKDLSGFLATE